MKNRIEVSDGSSWPRPSTEADDLPGVAWRLTHVSIDLLTRSDLLEAASVISAYEHLVLVSTRAKRDLVCRDIRAELSERDGRADQ